MRISKDHCERLDRAASLVVDRVPYLDTLQIWTPRTFAAEHLAALRETVKIEYFTLPRLFWPYQRRLLVQQPTTEALRLLLESQGNHWYCINRLDFALDLITRTPGDARQLQEFFRSHLVQKWHGQRRGNSFEETNYWAAEIWTRRNFALYSDKPSKIDGRPCCHLEFRLKRAEACEAAGFDHLATLFQPDHQQIWRREMCLMGIDRKKLRRAVEASTRATRRDDPDALIYKRKKIERRGTKMTNRQKRDHVERIIWALCVRCLSPEDRDISMPEIHLAPAQAWKELFPWFAGRSMVKLDPTPFIPGSGHAP